MLWVLPCFVLAVRTAVVSGSGHGDYVVSTDCTSRYHGPGATTVVLPDGTLADTPEVAAARTAHLAALHKAQALWYGNSASSNGDYSHSDSTGYRPNNKRVGGVQNAGWASYNPSSHGDYVVSTDYTSRYHGPGATPVVLSDGTLADTPEVAAARAAHLTALHKAKALWYGRGAGSDNGNYGSHSNSHSGSYTGSSSLPGKRGTDGGAWPSYNGPLASATVLPSGYLADSTDVARAKVAHLGAVAQAYTEAAKWPAERGHNEGWKQW